MKMFLVQHIEMPGAPWVDCVREDLIHHGGEHLPALFYTFPEAEAYITAMCGLIHCGGDPTDFRIVNVVDDGVNFTYGEAVVRS
jgi:hypothetical protein